MFDEPTYFTFCTLKEVATGIQTITVEKPQSDAVYTLDGRRIANSPEQSQSLKPEQSQSLKPGIYIKGGKKFIVK